jgi:hypothetical protein
MVELITILLISLNPCFQGFGRIGMNFSKAPYKRYAILTNIYISAQKGKSRRRHKGASGRRTTVSNQGRLKVRSRTLKKFLK